MEIVWQRVPGRRACNSNARRPKLLRRCRGMMSWWRLAERSRWRLTIFGRRLAAVDKVLTSIAQATLINGHSELKLDALRNIQPMELGAKRYLSICEHRSSSDIHCRQTRTHYTAPGWLRGPAVEHRSLAGVLSLSCARPVADGWPLMWVNHPL